MKNFIIITLLLLPKYSLSTCILVGTTDTSVIIAADSKRSFFVFDDKGRKYSSNAQEICKIHRIKDFYIAIAGLNDSMLLYATNKACINSTNIHSAISQLDAIMKSDYYNGITQLRNISKKLFDERFPGNKPLISEIVIIERNKKGISVNKINHYVKVKNGYPIGIVMDVIDLKQMPIACLGVCDHIYSSNIPKYLSNTELFKHFIELEIKSHTDYVGYPIKILEISKGSHKWLYGKTPCSF